MDPPATAGVTSKPSTAPAAGERSIPEAYVETLQNTRKRHWSAESQEPTRGPSGESRTTRANPRSSREDTSAPSPQLLPLHLSFCPLTSREEHLGSLTNRF